MVTMKNRLTAVLLLTMATGAVAAPAAGDDSKRVLVLHTYGYDAPGRIPFDTALVRALREVAGVKAELYIETLDPNRFPGEAHARRMREYLREKYSGKKIAVLIAAFDEALSFLLDERDPVFPDVPIAAVLTRYPQTTDDRVAVVWSGNIFSQSLSLALRLHPRARQIAIINAAPPRGGSRDPVGEEAESQIDAIGVEIPVISLRNLPLDELLDRVQALPPDTIIFFARQYMGRRGEPIAHDDALREVVRVARAPIYVSTNQLVGLGAVGGVVMNLESEARDVANLVLRLTGEESLRIPPVESTLLPIFDGRELRRWGIDEAQLPPNSVIPVSRAGSVGPVPVVCGRRRDRVRRSERAHRRPVAAPRAAPPRRKRAAAQPVGAAREHRPGANARRTVDCRAGGRTQADRARTARRSQPEAGAPVD
jgi:hypothetical protein